MCYKAAEILQPEALTIINISLKRETLHVPTHSCEGHCVKNHRQLGCLFESLFSQPAKTTTKLSITSFLGAGYTNNSWWRHQMEIFSLLLALCAGNSPVTGKIPTQRPVTRSFNVFFDLRMNKRLSKRSWGWRFETPWCSLWRHGNRRITLFPNKARDMRKAFTCHNAIMRSLGPSFRNS